MRLVGLALVLVLVSGCIVESSSTPLTGTGPARLLFAGLPAAGGSWDIYLEDVESGQRRNLTATPRSGGADSDDKSPAVSPDGSRVAYTSTADHVSDGTVADEIFVMDLDGGRSQRLTSDDDADAGPQWNAAGDVVFTTCPSSVAASVDCRLDRFDLGTGGDRSTLADGLGLVVDVALSPDGTEIAYAGFDEQLQPRGLFVGNIGLDRERLADGRQPQWSPDGDRIAFISDRDRNGACIFPECFGNAPELYVMDADGSEQERLTETTAAEITPAWTPDGEWILFSRIAEQGGGYDLFALRSDGSCEVRLTQTPEWEWSPVWLGTTEPLDC